MEWNPEIGRGSCLICGREFSDKSNIRRHIRLTHRENISVRCDYCNKWFKNSYSLKGHINYAHVNTNAVDFQRQTRISELNHIVKENFE